MYPHEEAVHLHSKVSVSELKKQSQADAEAYSVIAENRTSERIWGNEQEEQPTVLTGAAKGTAYHRVMETIDLPDRNISKEDLEKILTKMETEGIINTEEKESLSVSKIRWFLQSPLADRMRQAAAQGHLHRESQFMAMMPHTTSTLTQRLPIR